uniref:Uncharacterized protein n=1 Tax=Cucumis melo TaxID=3656 RepID=A0A9I9E724_CUCME
MPRNLKALLSTNSTNKQMLSLKTNESTNFKNRALEQNQVENVCSRSSQQMGQPLLSRFESHLHKEREKQKTKKMGEMPFPKWQQVNIPNG